MSRIWNRWKDELAGSTAGVSKVKSQRLVSGMFCYFFCFITSDSSESSLADCCRTLRYAEEEDGHLNQPFWSRDRSKTGRTPQTLEDQSWTPSSGWWIKQTPIRWKSWRYTELRETLNLFFIISSDFQCIKIWISRSDYTEIWLVHLYLGSLLIKIQITWLFCTVM